MPTGWRPEDVKQKYPRSAIEDVYHFKRYNTPSSGLLKAYALFQLVFTLVLLLFMFYNYGQIGFSGLLWFGAFIFLGIYGYTSLMDRTNYAWAIELFRGLAGIFLILTTGDWFGIDNFVGGASYVVLLYFMMTIAGGIYFTFFEEGPELRGEQAV